MRLPSSKSLLIGEPGYKRKGRNRFSRWVVVEEVSEDFMSVCDLRSLMRSCTEPCCAGLLIDYLVKETLCPFCPWLKLSTARNCASSILSTVGGSLL